MISLIIGILIIVFTIVMVIISLAKTPDNLEGYYGVMFWLIAIGGIIGGLYLIVTSFFG